MCYRKIFTVIISCILTSILLCSCQIQTKGSDALKAPHVENDFNISILKIGQADSIILKTQNHIAVIDCGEDDDGAEVVKHLTDIGTKNIDYLFITHFDKDHVGGAPEVLDSFEANEIIIPDYVGTSDEYETFTSALQEKNITPTLLSKETTFTLDDVLFEVYPPLKKSYKESDNDFSLVIRATHGENTFLFTGDAQKDRLQELSNQLNLDCDFLKMPHHGKYNKYTLAFLKSVKPQYTVITDSEKNPAEDDTITALETVDSEIFHTKDGDINVLSNGHSISVSQ